jgi:hypothetical protein
VFYSQCKKCGKIRRWLDKEEVKDPKVVEENRHKPITMEEFEEAGKALDIYCIGCAPKEKKPGKKKAEEAEEAVV